VIPFEDRKFEGVLDMLNKFIIVDLETTGNLPKKGDKIIQFAAVVIENSKITEKFSSLINPKKPIPIFIEELTGLSDDMVQESPEFAEIAPKVMELLEGAYFVAHNVLFDLSFLQEELLQAGYEGFYGPVLDTVEMARIINPTADSYKLSDLAEKHGLVHDRPHQADSDALVTAELFLIFLLRLSKLPNRTLRQLSLLSGGLKSDLQTWLDDFVSEKEKSLEILPTELEIFKGIALKKLNIDELETVKNDTNSFPKDDEDKTTMIRKAFSGSFEERPGQFKMMDEVYRSFQDKENIIIEAGTGVGKSLAYLIPSVYFSIHNNLPVVVSTHTIQLQEQLLQKELPILEKILPFRIKAVLLKGRHHYISLEKFIHSLNDENDNYDSTLTKMQILVWLTETETGDRDELNLSSGGFLYWNKIKNDEPFIVQSKEWQGRDFYKRAKIQAQTANIIITNHSLLLSNMGLEHSVFPPFEYAVIDEGHHFEKTAGKYMGRTLDYLNVRLLLGQFGALEHRQLFYQLEQIVVQIKIKKENLLPQNDLNRIMADLIYENDEFFKIAMVFAKKKTNSGIGGLKRSQVHLTKGENGTEWKALVNSGERISFLLKDLITAISHRSDRIKHSQKSLDSEQIMVLEEISSYVKDLEELRSSIRILVLNESDLVKWIEVDFRSPQNTTVIHAQPVAVGESLGALFFAKKESVVITSATLTVKNSFTYLLKELGLCEATTNVMQVPSPFLYKKQVQLLISEDLPEINKVPLDEYVVAITEHIISLAEATKGRMLILFTAHDMLKKTYELMKESGFLEDFAIMAQGITSGSRTRLTRNFQRYEKGILLGTSSFWEGVDIPGEDLTCLVIVRLPFSPPDEPLTEARCRLIKEQGGNPFTEYSLPEAVLRFKQGFGRLIRTETDRGIVVIFDRRIMTTEYGKAFLESIPSVTVKKGNIDDLVERIHTWL
jgi:ATP-dependent DNA helicase DinG